MNGVTIDEFGIEGPKLITIPFFKDNRGRFVQSFTESLAKEIGIPTEWKQDNVSESRPSVLRGMHFQKKNPQGKLVSCVHGWIQDVCIDLRPDSPTFGEYASVHLKAWSYGRQMLWVPPGFGHGFLSITESIVTYKCTTEWDRESDSGINPLNCGIKWELGRTSCPVTISDKDKGNPSLIDYCSSCS